MYGHAPQGPNSIMYRKDMPNRQTKQLDEQWKYEDEDKTMTPSFY